MHLMAILRLRESVGIWSESMLINKLTSLVDAIAISKIWNYHSLTHWLTTISKNIRRGRTIQKRVATSMNHMFQSATKATTSLSASRWTVTAAGWSIVLFINQFHARRVSWEIDKTYQKRTWKDIYLKIIPTCPICHVAWKLSLPGGKG